MRPCYVLTLHKTYYEKGFFNLGVDVEQYISPEDQANVAIELEGGRTLAGKMTRKANMNGTPRIRAGVALSNWFMTHFDLGETINVIIIAPDRVKLEKRTR